MLVSMNRRDGLKTGSSQVWLLHVIMYVITTSNGDVRVREVI